jgi:hypothetical protein
VEGTARLRPARGRDLKRKLEQGSQQLQREALELSLEALLKTDQQAIGAELAAIVTAAMPRDPSGKCGEPFLREADIWVARIDAASAGGRGAAQFIDRASHAPPGQPRPQREDGAYLELPL